MDLPPISADPLDYALARLKALGADGADGSVGASAALGIGVREGALETIEREEAISLSLRAFIGKRAASVSGSRLERNAIDDMCERVIAMAQLAPEDPYGGLAAPDQLARDWPDLDLLDPDVPGPDQLRFEALAAEDSARAQPKVAKSNGANADWRLGHAFVAASNGFRGELRQSSFGLSVSVVAGDGDGMETDHAFDQARRRRDLRSAEAIGVEAGLRVAARLAPRRVETQRAAILYEPRLAQRLIGAFLNAITGTSVARGVSFLRDKLGAPVFSTAIDIIDDPLIPGGRGSRAFDGDGLATSRQKLIENGVLQTWLLNLTAGRQLGLASKGHGVGGFGGATGVGASNVLVSPGPETPSALARFHGPCLLVTDMFSPSINATTGDYSAGVSGQWLLEGTPAFPVSEITIAGNLIEMFRTLIAASDLESRSTIQTPSLLIPEMAIGGA